MVVVQRKEQDERSKEVVGSGGLYFMSVAALTSTEDLLSSFLLTCRGSDARSRTQPGG